MKKGHKLLIVESPSKIKTISKFLGGDFIIMSTFGHIIDLPTRKLGVEIDPKTHKISLEYVPLKDKKKVIDDICKVAKTVDEVYLASDPDREGEIIAWHIGTQIAKVFKDKSKIYRITFNEITKGAILDAIQHKTTINMEKVQAQQARRILDRWVGYEVSPILWRKIKKGLSAGRVQSAALLLLCTREAEILNFKPEESWSIHGLFKFLKVTVLAELVKISDKAFKLKNKQEADKVLKDAQKESYTVTDVTVKQRFKNPHPPFMTSTLQQAAFNKLGFSVDKTMLLAQKLYEGVPLGDGDKHEALITYMRTDSTRLSDTALNAAREYIQKEFGSKYLPSKALVYGGKGNAQDAHEAIRPINVAIDPEYAARYLPKDQAKLYEIIWQRFVACQMNPAEYSARQITIEGGKYLFRITGSTLIFDGFLKVYQDEEEEDEKLIKIPKEIDKGVALSLEKLDSKQHFTQPPPRYNESSLVKEMEKQGIGRPSTYAATLTTLQKRAYTTKDKKRFIPTELGKSVNMLLTENLPDVISLKFTAQMEEDLDKIAQGDVKRDVVLLDFYKHFQKELSAFAKDIKGGKKAVETDLTCPLCKKKLVIRFGKAGEFVGCSDFPTCNFTANFIRNEQGNIELVTPDQTLLKKHLTCPNCGKELVQKMGRFGPFLACPGYPDCKYIHQESLNMPCPSCGGKIIKRVSKRGAFWGCSNYPKCTFAIFGTPIEEKCPLCKSPYLVEVKNKDGVLVKCINKECTYIKS